MPKQYPTHKYHPERDPEIVESAEDEKALGAGWYDSPAEYGVETCPGAKPDPEIAKKRKSMSGAKKAEPQA